MLVSRKQLPLTWITLLVVLCLINSVFAKKKHHKDDDEDKEKEAEEVEAVDPMYITPSNKAWLEGLDLSDVPGKVRPVGSGVCEDAKCDGTDNDECFESCGNVATAEDIYGCNTEKTWALTFDDGPSNFTTELLDILDAAKVKATFVVMGAHAKLYPEVIRRAFQAGHQIASHTYSHPHLMSLTNEQIVDEVRATEEAIKSAIGVKPKYLRPPYGEADERVKAILKKMGYKVLMWNVDPTDYDVHMLKSGAERIQRAFDKAVQGGPNSLNVHKDPGYISLQHDLYKNSIAQVPLVVKKLQARGYNFMTAAECVGDSEPHERDADSVVINAQSVEAEKNDAVEEDATKAASESAAVKYSYSSMTVFLMIASLVAYFL